MLSLVVVPCAANADPLAELEAARTQAKAHFQAANARVRSVGRHVAVPVTRVPVPKEGSTRW